MNLVTAVTQGSRTPLAGRLEVSFRAGPGGKAFIDRQYASYPFHICRPHFLDPELPSMATLYCQSASGGIFAGDRLTSRFDIGPGARAHITTQASTIVHRMEQGQAEQSTEIAAGPDSLLEFLPDPIILFPQARLKSRLHIRMHQAASVICSDAFLQHDPGGSSEPFGCFESEIVVRREGEEPAVIDRQQVEGPDVEFGAPGVTGGNLVRGTVMVLTRASAPDELLAGIREALRGRRGLYGGASLLPNDCGVWARLLAEDGAGFKAGLDAVWKAARVAMTGTEAESRRK